MAQQCRVFHSSFIRFTDTWVLTVCQAQISGRNRFCHLERATFSSNSMIFLLININKYSS